MDKIPTVTHELPLGSIQAEEQNIHLSRHFHIPFYPLTGIQMQILI